MHPIHRVVHRKHGFRGLFSFISNRVGEKIRVFSTLCLWIKVWRVGIKDKIHQWVKFFPIPIAPTKLCLVGAGEIFHELCSRTLKGLKCTSAGGENRSESQSVLGTVYPKALSARDPDSPTLRCASTRERRCPAPSFDSSLLLQNETTEMLSHFGGHFVRVGRIELPSRPWQGRILPLNHTRAFIVEVY